MCSHSVVKLHEATEMFMMVDFVRGMTAKKFFKANMDLLSICSSCAVLCLHGLSAVSLHLHFFHDPLQPEPLHEVGMGLPVRLLSGRVLKLLTNLVTPRVLAAERTRRGGYISSKFRSSAKVGTCFVHNRPLYH